MINGLTKAQEAKIPEYLEKYKKVWMSTDPCDRAKAEKAITESYDYLNKKQNLNLQAPTFVWADSPYQAALKAAQLHLNKDNPTVEEVRNMASSASYGSFEAYWVSFYDFVVTELKAPTDNLIDIVKDIVNNCGVYWTFNNMVVISEKPIAIHTKDDKLHNENGYAIEYKDGTGVFAYDGQIYENMLQMKIDLKMRADEETKKKGKKK